MEADIINPGTMIAINSAPTEMSAGEARITPRAEGGSITARPPDPITGPSVIGCLYPRRAISGTRILPSSAVVAAPDPAKVANMVPPPTAIRLNLPGMRPNHASSTSISLAAIPDRNRSSPMRMNRGTGMIEKLATESIDASTIWLTPAKPDQKTYAPTRLTARKAKAIGIPIVKSTNSPPVIQRNAAHHSMGSVDCGAAFALDHRPTLRDRLGGQGDFDRIARRQNQRADRDDDQHDPGRYCKQRRLVQVADIGRPRCPCAEYRQREGNCKRYDVAEQCADLLHPFRHVDHERINIDMGAARHRPRSPEEGDVDQSVFGELGGAHDRAPEEVAHQHVDTDRSSAQHQDRYCQLGEDILDASEPACEEFDPAHQFPLMLRSFWINSGARACNEAHSTS